MIPCWKITLILGLTWSEAKARCPDGVVPACHNSIDTVTISGPLDAVSKFVAELKNEGIFAREVQSGGVAFHSYFMAQIAPALKEKLQKVIWLTIILLNDSLILKRQMWPDFTQKDVMLQDSALISLYLTFAVSIEIFWLC